MIEQLTKELDLIYDSLDRIEKLLEDKKEEEEWEAL